jgi:hypothetical protein
MATTAGNSIATQECETEGELVEVKVSGDGILVRIPCINSDTQYFDILDQLLKLSTEHSPITWTIDLSEQEGIPITLASALLGFGKYARSLGCKVIFTAKPRTFSLRPQPKRKFAWKWPEKRTGAK